MSARGRGSRRVPRDRWLPLKTFPIPYRGDVDVSAICRYHILEVKKAFEGPYKEYREQAQKWGRYSDEVPSPRPGAVSAVTGGRRGE